MKIRISYSDYTIGDDYVAYTLLENTWFDQLIDMQREADGLLPMLPTAMHPQDYDEDGWYDYVAVVDRDGLREVYAVVTTSQSDDMKAYPIELSEEDALDWLNQINEQSKGAFGKTAFEILDEERRSV